MWTIIIAQTHEEGERALGELLTDRPTLFVHSRSANRFNLVDAATGERGVVDLVGLYTAHRRLEGTRPDFIVISGDYTTWKPARPGLLTNVWHQVQRIVAMTPGSRVVWA